MVDESIEMWNYVVYNGERERNFSLIFFRYVTIQTEYHWRDFNVKSNGKKIRNREFISNETKKKNTENEEKSVEIMYSKQEFRLIW